MVAGAAFAVGAVGRHAGAAPRAAGPSSGGLAAPSPQAAGAAADTRPVAAIATALAAGAAGLAAAHRRQSVKGAAARRAKQVKLRAVPIMAPPVTSGEASTDMSDEFVVAILGDLHLDPRKMEDYETGREHVKAVLAEQKKHDKVGAALVSLGDLGESKSVRPKETQELFAGTTECHELANGFLSSFGVPYEVIGGNHDLEGIDEFKTDEENLEAFLRIHKKPSPQFCRQVADKVLLVGLSSTVFRSAKYTSHEVTIDDEQCRWFEDLVKNHPAIDGWKVFVFSHAPPIGSGLRVLQENHVVNGCCWLNHSGESARFIKLVREHRCIKGWFSGHFHLGQDYEDSITFPTIPREVGPYPNRGSCVFVQTSVMRKGTSRDKRQQSRFLRGNKDGFEICTINHADGGKMRVDAAISYSDCLHEVGVYAHEHEELRENTSFVKVYSPTEGDANMMKYDEEEKFSGPVGGGIVSKDTTNWWYMSCGRVLGIYDGRLIEYDPSTLAPLGLVVGADELIGKRVFIANSSSDDAACRVSMDTLASGEIGMEGADCADDEPVEQSLLLIDAGRNVTVVQPNDDGSYWRKIVRNKMIRMKEKRRWQAGEAYAKLAFPDEDDVKVLSSWGPYTSIVGTAKETGVKGLTTQKKIKEAWDLLGGGRIAAWREMGDELKAAFCNLDKDKSGYIDAAELKDAVRMLDPSCDETWVGDMMKLADTDGDNQISLEEFARLMLFQRIRKAAQQKKVVRG